MGNHRQSAMLEDEEAIASRDLISDLIKVQLVRDDYVPNSRRAETMPRQPINFERLNDIPIKQIVKLTLVGLGLLLVIMAVLVGIVRSITEHHSSSGPAKVSMSNVANVKPLPTVTVTHTQIVHEPLKQTVKTVTVTAPPVTKTIDVPGKVSTSCQLATTITLDENKQFAIFMQNYGGTKLEMDNAIYAITQQDLTLINKSIGNMNGIDNAASSAVLAIIQDNNQLTTAIADCGAGK